MSEGMLDQLERNAFEYFVRYANLQNGLVADTTRPGSPASIAVAGLALTVYAIGVERGFISRAGAIDRTLAMLRFFAASPQGAGPDVTGHQGFYYHFLNRESGLRMWKSELSLIDSTFLLAGMFSAAMYFAEDAPEELEIRTRVKQIYERADWRWAQNERGPVSHGWKPEYGFLHYGWEGYNEAILLYVLGLGSPTHPLPESSYHSWTLGYQWENLYGIDVLHAGSLFMNQFSHAWIDFRGIRDAFMREKEIDYFENSRRATFLHQAYARRNPRGFTGYGPNCWGISACDGPGLAMRRIDKGRPRRFLGYAARSIPCGPDDGTLAPGAVVASLPFAPEIVLPALEHLAREYPRLWGQYGVKGGFNPSFAVELDGSSGWVSDDYFGLDQGMTVLMIENQRSGFVWTLMKKCRVLVDGLRRAGFSGGWLRPRSIEEIVDDR